MERRHSLLKFFTLSCGFILAHHFFSHGYAQGMPPDMMGFPEDPGYPPQGADMGYGPAGFAEGYLQQEQFAPANPQEQAPAAIPQQQTQQPAQAQDAGVPGPETVSLPEEKVGTQGNWMKKREWLLKANEANNQIQDLAASINGIRKSYTDKYRGIDEILDEFYKQLGQEQGKLQEIFDGVDRYLEKKKKKEIAALSTASEDEAEKNLQAKIEVIEQQITTMKGLLEQFKLDMKSVEDLDRSITERMKILDEQINAANDEASSAQKKTNDLWYIIDDKKARVYYYDIKGSSLEKIKAIDRYLQNDLMNDFDAVIDTIKTHITKTQDEIKGLEDKGLIIKDRARRVEQLKMKDLEDAELKKKEAELAELKRAREKARKPQKTSWYEDIFQFFINIFKGIRDFFESLYHNLFGASIPVKTIKPKILPTMPVTDPGKTSQIREQTPSTTPSPTPAPQPQLPEGLPQTPLQMPTT